MADLQPADVLWHDAIDGGQHDGQLARGQEGGGQGEQADVGDCEQVVKIGGRG